MSRIKSKTEKTSADGTEAFPIDANQWMTTQRVIDVAKAYADSLAANLGKRQTVRAATTANVTISTALNNADTLDGVTLATGNLVLVKNQFAPEQNGIYVVGASPARFSQFDTYDEHPGSLIIVQEGTTNADTKWLCTSNVGGTLNTTAIVFAQDVAVSIAEDLTTAETNTAKHLRPNGVGGVEWADDTSGGGSNGSFAIFDHHVNAGNTGTGEDDLYSDTITAGQLAANDDKIFAEYGGVYVSSATATRQIRAYFGGTAIFDTGALTFASLSSAWTLKILIIRVSSSVIRYECTFDTEGTTLAAYTSAGEVTGLTLSATNVLKITGEAASTGAATNDIVAKLGTVWYMPAVGTPVSGSGWLYSTGTRVDVKNTTTETTVLTYSIPGGTLGTDKALSIKIQARFLHAIAGTATVRLKYGATTVLTIGVVEGAFTVDKSADVWFILSATGATNAQRASGRVDVQDTIPNQSTHPGSGIFSIWNQEGTATEDSTASKTLAVTVQWGSASNSLEYDQAWAGIQLMG